jgi:hypothetical protein
MQWLEPGRRFWMATASPTGGGQCVTVVSTGELVTQVQHCFDGRSAIVDPAHGLIAAFRPLDTVDIFRLDGTPVLTTAIRGTDAFAMTPDGRFACTGEACDDLRCVVGGAARPVTDAACAGLRTPGFSVLAEVRPL